MKNAISNKMTFDIFQKRETSISTQLKNVAPRYPACPMMNGSPPTQLVQPANSLPGKIVIDCTVPPVHRHAMTCPISCRKVVKRSSGAMSN